MRAAGGMKARGGQQHDDWDLVQSTVSGSSDAFEVLVARYDRLLHYLIFRRRPSVLKFADPHDIIDETWYQVLRRALDGNFDPSVKFSSWLGGICLNVLKRKEFQPQGASLVATDADGDAYVVDPPGDGDTPADIVEQAEVVAALKVCLEDRPDAERRLYELIYVQELTNVAAADELGCSEAYIRQKLMPKLHAALVRCLARKGFRDEVPESHE